MGYENAPATKMVATHCAICSKPLVDADSVEAGIGPHCRKRHGYGVPNGDPDWNRAAELLLAGGMDPQTLPCWGEDAHKASNVLTHQVAAGLGGKLILARLVAAVEALGYSRLARAMGKALGAVVVERGETNLRVKAPYSETFNLNVRRVPGQRWNREEKVREVPVESAKALWVALKNSYDAGTLVFGSKTVIIEKH